MKNLCIKYLDCWLIMRNFVTENRLLMKNTTFARKNQPSIWPNGSTDFPVDSSRAPYYIAP